MVITEKLNAGYRELESYITGKPGHFSDLLGTQNKA